MTYISYLMISSFYSQFFFTNPGVEQFLGVCGFEVRDNWMIFMDTEVAFLKIDTGKRQLLSYRKKVDSLKAYEVSLASKTCWSF